MVLLISDTEFESYINAHMIGPRVYKGNWESKKDTVILNSNLQPGEALVNVIECQDSSLHTTVRFQKYPMAYILSDKDSIIRPINGLVSLPGIYDSLKFLFVSGHNLQGYKIEYAVKQKGANDFQPFFEEIDIYQVVTNEKYLFRRNKLIALPYRAKYEKVDTAEKKW